MEEENKDKIQGVVVSHTHWDREWYLSFQEFRKWLVKMMDDLVENLPKNPDFKSFMMDGQTVVIEDYLEIRPENEKSLCSLARTKRIEFGPFYVLADEFLESGEGLIRNLLLGHKLCDQYDIPVTKVGYVPDTFGHIWQLPQILEGFKIPNLFYLRGYPPVFGNHEEYDGKNDQTSLEHWYESPNGSRVLTSHLILGYGNFAGAAEEKIKADQFSGHMFPWVTAVFKVGNCFEILVPRMKTATLLLMNGTDHREAEWEMPEMIKRFNEDPEIQEDFPIQLQHGSLMDYHERVKKKVESEIDLPTLTGEARGSMYSQVTPACISTRMNLKLWNWRCQRELEKYAEPFSAMSWVFGARYQESYIELAWKWLIKNHPHDSICGCSLDRVHQDMITRFNWSYDNANDVAKYSCATILSGVDIDAIQKSVKSKHESSDVKVIAVFNPNAFEGPFFVEGYVSLSRYNTYQLYDAATGEQLANYHLEYIPDYRENVKEGQYLYKQFQSNYCLGKVSVFLESLPAFGYKTLCLVAKNEKPCETKPNSTGVPAPIDGKDISVSFNEDGSINIHDKVTNVDYENLNVYEDGADDGDEYDYAPLLGEAVLYSKKSKAKFRIIDRNNLFTQVETTIAFEIPYELKGDVDSVRVRSSQTTILNLTTVYKIYKNLKRVDVKTNVVNTAKGHRLRAIFPCGFEAERSYADDHFMVMERTIELPKDDGWYQEMQGLYHQDTFVDLTTTEKPSESKSLGRGIALFNKGLCEFEIVKAPAILTRGEPQNAIALTLFRSVAWLSQKGHLGRKSGLNGPNLQTPGAQLMGKEFDFEYSLFCHQGNWQTGKLYRAAHSYNSPPRLINNDHKLRNEKIDSKLPYEMSLLSINNPNIVLSSVKKCSRVAGTREGVILRIFNPTSVKQTTKVRLGFEVQSAFQTNLLERNEQEVQIEPSRDGVFVRLEVSHHKIYTLKLVL